MAEKVKINFLGTGSAIPTERRNHPAVLMRYKDEVMLFDCGEGTQRQFRKAKLNPCRVTRIFITHWHGDHVLGLPGLLQTLNLNGYNGELIIYGPRGSKADFKSMLSPHLGFYWNVSRQAGNKFDIVVKEVDEGTFLELEDFFVEAVHVDHGCPALAYSITFKEKKRLDKEKLEKLKIPNSPLIGELAKGKVVEIGGKKIDGKKMVYVEPQRKITFLMDTRYTDSAVKLSKESDLLISEATHSAEEQEIAREHGHLTSVDAATIAKKAKVKRLILMHLSQRYDMIPKVILEEAKKVFKDVSVVEDFDEVSI
jgi:ribonuclease Z